MFFYSPNQKNTVVLSSYGAGGKVLTFSAHPSNSSLITEHKKSVDSKYYPRILAQREGFEPPETLVSTVFKFWRVHIFPCFTIVHNGIDFQKSKQMTAYLLAFSCFWLLSGIFLFLALFCIFSGILTAFCRVPQTQFQVVFLQNYSTRVFDYRTRDWLKNGKNSPNIPSRIKCDSVDTEHTI